MATKKIEKRTSNREDHTSLAYQGIKKMLFNNEILPGQKVSYHELAERLQMSTTPVIQALKLIELSGIVRHEPNRGYYTQNISLKEIQEIYDTRELIEISLLPDIINNLEEEGIRKVRESLENRNQCGKESELYDRLMIDKNFHLTLASLSNHKTQVQILHFLFDLLYLKYSASLLFVTSDQFVGTQHQTIFNAIVSQNLQEARDAFKSHFRRVKAQTLVAMGQMIANSQTSA